ncbi:LppU/SCO3897 family protein [Kutzneria sp. CA-103260]|uniref:LppU/SCO3897 family protein n=1 Tax=Kutzneria sp. CA-103260 TaxID=2802641 RepID=UPI001BAC5729|nr:hypothetical protein [Kutzneria sp. CA-103260]QUQ69509.1 hypothetical protein JJ691_72670 [Kutzneria sp. CA-103260]
MSTPPMPPGPQGPQAPQPQGQPYPQAPQGQPVPQGQFPGQPGQFPGQQQPFQGGGAVPPGVGPVPGTGPLPGQPQPFPQAPMGTPPKKRRRLLASIGGAIGVIVVVLIVRVVIGLGVGTAVNSADDAHNTAVGDCASVTGTTTKPNYDKVDCGSGKENYIVGMVIKPSESCPDKGGYDEYYEDGTLNNVKLCLAPVLADGKCYDLNSSGPDMGYSPQACSSTNFQVKVIKDKADKNACGDAAAGALAYDPLKLTYCLSQPSGS